MSSFELLAYAFVGLIFGLVFFVKGLYSFRKKRLVENIPTSKIRSLSMGLVEIYGKVSKYHTLLKSPVSQKDCVFYNFEIQEQRSNGKHSYWHTIFKGTDRVEFYIEDPTGEVLINPKGANFDLVDDLKTKTGMFKEPPMSVRKFLESRRYNHETLFGLHKQLMVKEQFLSPNDHAYVLGTAGDNPYVEEATSVEGHKDIMISKGSDIFIISDRDEKQLIRTYVKRSLMWLLGGGSIVVICIGVILLLTLYSFI